MIPKHGGYRKLKSFQLAQLTYDITARFCQMYIDRKSRTRDQMVQAARSGTQNIAEGSQASGTSKKMELKLTNVARASLEELKLDYEDFLRQRGYPQWPPEHPILERFKALRCNNLDQVRAWVAQELATGKPEKAGQPIHTDPHGRTQTCTADLKPNKTSVRPGRNRGSVSVGDRPCRSVSSGTPAPVLPAAVYVANAALSLLNLCCYLLDRQLASQARAFEHEGGFTERLYRTRTKRRGH
ncbi:MAG TPA: four helix bundle suffix domain-containing protein [Planctomycetota bacterium]|nr:four helix bundle suffix domain-containing protein [Planctomycetota bacterium]